MTPYTVSHSIHYSPLGRLDAVQSADSHHLTISIWAYKAITAISDAVTGTIKWWRRRSERRASINALWALNDRTLRDIGVERGEISSIVDGVINYRPRGATDVRRTTVTRHGGDRPAAANDDNRNLAA